MKASRRPEYEVLGNVIKGVREDRRFSQRDLARKVRRLQSSIAKIELGDQGIDIVEFLDVARALGLTGTEFFRMFEERLSSQG